MPREEVVAVYCYCSPPRYALVTHYSMRERFAMWMEEHRLVSQIAERVAELLGPTEPVRMVATDPIYEEVPFIMCGRSIYQELRDLDIQASGSISQAEAQRLVHRTLYDRVRNARTWREEESAREEWDMHIEEHKQQARARRAERVK